MPHWQSPDFHLTDVKATSLGIQVIFLLILHASSVQYLLVIFVPTQFESFLTFICVSCVYMFVPVCWCESCFLNSGMLSIFEVVFIPCAPPHTPQSSRFSVSYISFFNSKRALRYERPNLGSHCEVIEVTFDWGANLYLKTCEQ